MWYTKQRTKNDKTPAQTAKILSDEDKDMICAKIKKNIELRLNVDYRKTFTSKWKSKKNIDENSVLKKYADEYGICANNITIIKKQILEVVRIE